MLPVETGFKNFLRRLIDETMTVGRQFYQTVIHEKNDNNSFVVLTVNGDLLKVTVEKIN